MPCSDHSLIRLRDLNLRIVLAVLHQEILRFDVAMHEVVLVKIAYRAAGNPALTGRFSFKPESFQGRANAKRLAHNCAMLLYFCHASSFSVVAALLQNSSLLQFGWIK